MLPLDSDEVNNENIVAKFDLSNAMKRLGIEQGACCTPQASPVKRHRRPTRHLMNGGAVPSYGLSASNSGEYSTNTEDSAALFDFLTPTTVSSSSCSGFSGNSPLSSPVSVGSNLSSKYDETDGIAQNLDFRIETIQEGVEVTLMRRETGSSMVDDSADDDDLNSINSSILMHRTPSKNCHSNVTSPLEVTTPQTPAGVPLCGWLCAAADTEKHICESLGVEHLVCWQSTVPSTGKNSANHPSDQPRSRRSHQQLHHIRRNLQFHQPIQQSTSFNIQPSKKTPTPTKPASFPGMCTRREKTPVKTDIGDDGYGSDPESYIATSRATTAIVPRQLASFRAKTVDELFNERIPCLRHTEFSTVEVTLFLERGHLRYANAAPRLCCATVNNNTLEEMGLLEVSKVLCPSKPEFLLAADPNRCLMVRSCQGVSWTLEIATPGVAVEIAGLLKLAVATLAASVLTEQTLDRLYFDG